MGSKPFEHIYNLLIRKNTFLLLFVFERERERERNAHSRGEKKGGGGMGIGESVTWPPEIDQTKLNLGLHIDLCLIGLVSKVVFWFYIISHASFNSPSAP